MQQMIVVIDNQFKQFKTISAELLAGGYSVFPSESEYKEFVDPIRVYCDRRYSDSRNRKAKDLFMSKLAEIDVSIFIVDFKLSGSCDGMNGVQLALNIRGADARFEKTPVMFLSRTPRDSREVKLEVRLFDRFTWVEKGYAGMSMLEKGYFKLHILDEIPKLLAQRGEDIHIAMANSLMKEQVIHSNEESICLEAIINSGKVKEEQRLIIEQLAKAVRELFSSSEIRDLLNRLQKTINIKNA